MAAAQFTEPHEPGLFLFSFYTLDFAILGFRYVLPIVKLNKKLPAFIHLCLKRNVQLTVGECCRSCCDVRVFPHIPFSFRYKSPVVLPALSGRLWFLAALNPLWKWGSCSTNLHIFPLRSCFVSFRLIQACWELTWMGWRRGTRRARVRKAKQRSKEYQIPCFHQLTTELLFFLWFLLLATKLGFWSPCVNCFHVRLGYLDGRRAWCLQGGYEKPLYFWPGWLVCVAQLCTPGLWFKVSAATCVKSSVSLNLPVYQHRLSFIYSFPLPTVIVSGDNYWFWNDMIMSKLLTLVF